VWRERGKKQDLGVFMATIFVAGIFEKRIGYTIRYRALLTEYMALLTEYRALLTECKTLLTEYMAF